MRVDTVFDMEDKVILDGDSSIVAVIIAVMVRGANTNYQVSWIQDGRISEPWIEEWRISKWEE